MHPTPIDLDTNSILPTHTPMSHTTTESHTHINTTPLHILHKVTPFKSDGIGTDAQSCSRVINHISPKGISSQSPKPNKLPPHTPPNIARTMPPHYHYIQHTLNTSHPTQLEATKKSLSPVSPL